MTSSSATPDPSTLNSIAVETANGLGALLSRAAIGPDPPTPATFPNQPMSTKAWRVRAKAFKRVGLYEGSLHRTGNGEQSQSEKEKPATPRIVGNSNTLPPAFA